MKEQRLKILNDCLSAIQHARDVLEEVRDEEQDAFDNMPEGLQYSERGDSWKGKIAAEGLGAIAVLLMVA